MKKIYSIIFLVVLICISQLIGCSKNESDIVIPADVIREASAFDIANNGTSNDIYIEVLLNTGFEPDEIRVVLAKKSEAVTINDDQAQKIPEANYHVFKPRQNVRQGLADITGKAIESEVDYDVFFLIVKSGKAKLANVKASISLHNANPLNGNYLGAWDDNIYVNQPITSTLTADDNGNVSGNLFFSKNFKPCCGGFDDGDIRFTIVGGSVTNFIYDENLRNYKGGCTGKFPGTGKFDIISFEVDFTGDDCDGSHVGKLRLKKLPK